MGAKDSKRACLNYEDAVKKISEVELRRLCEAFKRLSGGNTGSNGLISISTFTQHVLGEGVPHTIANCLYTACGGTQRGIAFKELICGLVLLTKGTQDEKIKFLWTLYSNDSGTHICRSEFQRALQLEGPPVKNNIGRWPDRTVTSLFGVGQDRVTFEHFRAWITYNREATLLSSWLLIYPSVSLSTEIETPTFYQTLAGVTHLEETDICELEKSFWLLQGSGNSGQLDLACLSQLVSPPIPASLCSGLFRAFDANGDGHVDFKELCCGISAACRGPAAERLKFCFRMLDVDQDGKLVGNELKSALDAITLVWKESHGENHENNFDSLTIALKELQNKLTPDGTLPQEDFLLWANGEGAEVSAPLLELLFQVCHVALGLRPRCRHHEREIALGWLEREQRRGYRVGQFWYLVGANWWRNWQNYTSSPPSLGERCGCKTSTLNSSYKDISPSSIADDDDTCSLASSSGVSSGGSASGGTRKAPGGAISIAPPQPPGPVDNTSLVCEWPAGNRVPSLTGEGGCLRRDTPLVQHRDFELVPDSLWKALQQWYGGPLPLPRQVISSGGDQLFDIELYPLSLRILRHVQPAAASAPGGGSATAWGGVVGGYGAAAAALAPAAAAAAAGLRRYLAHTAAFSRLASIRQVCEFLAVRLGLRTDEIRIWHCPNDSNTPATLLDDDYATLQQAGIADGDQILLEVQNKDLTWPEELGALLDVGQGGRSRSTVAAVHMPPPGATGLHNLGNTCFMNAALQAVSNTRVLTQYFRIDNGRLRELNISNPLGTRGQVARRYAELCRELWAGGGARSVAPLKMRWCVTRHAPHLGGGGQHDSQELLAWLLDALHEDLNRSPISTGENKQRSEIKDSNGRPDAEVADEAWKHHLERDHSIITDLFYGQLKSKVTCQTCGHDSVRFDAFNLLSLPLPMEESCTLCEVLVIRLDGETPIKYAVRLNSDARIGELRKRVASMCGIPVSRLSLAEVVDSQVRRLLSDSVRLSTCAAVPPLEITAYEIEEGAPEIVPHSILMEEANDVMNSGELIGEEGGEDVTLPIARSPEVSATSALCMPNILCFKTGEQAVLDAVQQRNRRRRSSPETETIQNGPMGPGYIVAVHRKSVRQDTYLLSQHKWRPTLFGVPLLLGRRKDMTCQKLYAHIARQVARLLSPSPPNGSQSGNHAADCDDSLGYTFPFTLRMVTAGGRICSICPWTRFCRGCEIKCTDNIVPWETLTDRDTCDRWVAIDWEPTALHLRYQSGREKSFIEHESVAFCRKRHTEPIDLDYCLRVFTSEEKLEAQYHCSGCRSKQPATKKLQIWKLPPILIIHLKRFDFANGKWVKTQKAVNFPFDNFDPTPYLASVPQETILRHKQLKEEEKLCKNNENKGSGDKNSSNSTRERLESTSLLRTPILDEDLRDFHEHHLKENQDPLELSYRLYAVISHSGMLNGGHYIAYASNPNNSWYCYNDSSCREVTSVSSQVNNSIEGENINHPTPRIDSSSAYILFYERKGIDYAPYLPKNLPSDDNNSAVVDTDDDCDNDLRKQLCLLS